MWSGRCCSMEIAILVSLIGISFKPLFIESTYLEQVSTFETGSGLDLDLTLAGSNHKRKSAELNLDLSLGNKSYKSNKAPEVSLPAPMRLGSNPLYLSEAGPSRPEYQSLGLTREKYSMISATDSTKRSINEVQPNFYFHTPPNTLNLEKLSALGNNQHNYLHLPQYFWEQPVRMSDGGSNEIEENHRIVYNNFPHKRKFMDENSPEKIATQNQNILHYPIPNGFGTYEISHGKSFNVEDLESQESRISAGYRGRTKNQNASYLAIKRKKRKYRTQSLKTEKERESKKIESWKDVKVNKYIGLPSLRNWIFVAVKNRSNVKCLAEPFNNVLYLTCEDLGRLRESLETDIDYYRQNRHKIFSTTARRFKILEIYKNHEDFFSSWKTEDSRKYFEALGKSWEADYGGRADAFQARIRCVRFATAYAIERIGFMTEKNHFKLFVDIEKAKEDAYEILKSYWKTLPLGKIFTGTWQNEKDGKPTNIPLLDHLRLQQPNSALRASYGSDTLSFVLRHILPSEYHQSLLISTNNYGTSPKSLTNKLNNIAISIDHQKNERNL